MTSVRRDEPHLFRFAAVALFCATLLGCNSKDPAPTPPPPPPLTQQGLVYSTWQSATPDLHDRLLLAHAIARGKNEAIVMVATRMGAVPAVAAHIARLGGDIQGRFDDVGYLYALLPIERLPEVSALPDVLMAHLDGGAVGGSYVLDRDLVGQGGAYMWNSRAGRHPRADATYVTLTETLLGFSSAQPSVSSPELSGRAQSSVPLSIGIDNLLEIATHAIPGIIPPVSAEGRLPAGGQDIYALIANRAVEVHGTPLYAVAGDGARVDSIMGAASARRVLAIGGLKVNLIEDGDDDETAAWPSRGPASDGGAKPDLIVEPDQAGPSTSQVAVTISNLMQTARAELLPADARHISWALRMGARRLDGYQAHEQGFGVIDAARATELLREVKSRQFDLPDILTRAPVKTFLARFLPQPGVGQGLYEREGWLLKRPDKRVITLVRQNGPSTPLAYTLQWRGNDGTFKTLSDEVILPFDTPVDVEIEITPTQLGVHSAHLYLLDKVTSLPVQAVMTTIVASEQFTAANGYTIQHSRQALTKQRSRSYFLEVPPNVAALNVSVGATAGQAEVLLGMGGPVDDRFNLPRPGRSVAAGKPVILRVPYPPPGVYELTLLPSEPSQVEVNAFIQYVDSQLDEAPPKNNSTTLWMNNIYAPLRRSSVLTEVGARRELKDVGGPTGMRTYNINVPAGSTTLRVAASPPDGRARLGLYLYDCATGTCQLWGSDALTRTLEKILIVPAPRAGLWRVVIDATASGTAFNYTEIITNPRFGSGTAEGPDEPRRIGARWNQKVSFKMERPVPFGYEAVAVMDVIDRESDLPPHPLRLTTQVFKLH